MVTDTLGQSTTSAGITVTVDNLPLLTTVIIPSNGATLGGSPAVLDAVASGTSDVTSVQFVVNGGSLSNDVVGTATQTIYGWIVLWNSASVPNGNYTLQSVATEVGGVSATSPGVSITVSNPPPSTQVLIPSNGATVSGGSQVLDAIGSVDVSSVSFQLNGLTIATATSSLWGWYALWNSASVSNGTYTFQSVASYPNGVTGTSEPITITIAN